MGQIGLIKGLMMTALFALAITMFTIQFGADNDSDILLNNDSDYAALQTSITGNVQDFNENSNTSINTLMSTTQEAGDQSASSGGQFKVGVFSTMALATTIITLGFNKIFGADTGFGIFLTAVTSLLVWMIGLYIWKAWKGNPD